MTTSIDVANEALQECLARATIASFTERSKEAQAVSNLYASTRDALLRLAPWNFARALAQLALVKALPGTPENPTKPAATGWQPGYPPLPWLYSYLQPGDCVRLRFIVGASPAAELRSSQYVIGTDVDGTGNPATVVLTNQQQALAVYTRRIISEDLWDAQFRLAFVKMLASRLVLPLAGDKALKKMLQDEATKLVMEARISDGNEGTTLEEHVPDWIRIRGAGGFMRWDALDCVGGTNAPDPYVTPAIPDFTVGEDTIA